MATGDLADALHRDLLRDRLTIKDLGWRGLWAYITTAPPGTALHYARSEGWTIGDKIAAEQLYEQRQQAWRYTAVNFTDGAKEPIPEPIPYPGAKHTERVEAGDVWEAALANSSPEVRALLQGG